MWYLIVSVPDLCTLTYLDVYLVLTVCVMCLFIAVFWICLHSVIVAFPGHTHLRSIFYFFLYAVFYSFQIHEGLDPGVWIGMTVISQY